MNENIWQGHFFLKDLPFGVVEVVVVKIELLCVCSFEVSQKRVRH